MVITLGGTCPWVVLRVVVFVLGGKYFRWYCLGVVLQVVVNLGGTCPRVVVRMVVILGGSLEGGNCPGGSCLGW